LRIQKRLKLNFSKEIITFVAPRFSIVGILFPEQRQKSNQFQFNFYLKERKKKEKEGKS